MFHVLVPNVSTVHVYHLGLTIDALPTVIMKHCCIWSIYWCGFYWFVVRCSKRMWLTLEVCGNVKLQWQGQLDEGCVNNFFLLVEYVVRVCRQHLDLIHTVSLLSEDKQYHGVMWQAGKMNDRYNLLEQ